jgi:hypothetical protein
VLDENSPKELTQSLFRLAKKDSIGVKTNIDILAVPIDREIPCQTTISERTEKGG